jgi:hypothetical protein
VSNSLAPLAAFTAPNRELRRSTDAATRAIALGIARNVHIRPDRRVHAIRLALRAGADPGELLRLLLPLRIRDPKTLVKVSRLQRDLERRIEGRGRRTSRKKGQIFQISRDARRLSSVENAGGVGGNDGFGEASA